MAHDKGTTTARRNFLKLAGVGAAASSVAVVTQVAPAAATEAVPATGKLGYRETEHVKKVYETARF
jgi:hypothetical protein